MEKLHFKYSPEQKVPITALVTYGLQWLLVIVPFVVILGTVVGVHEYADSPALQLMYLRKVFLATGLTLAVQVVWGHRLPIIVGPAAVLLSAITANQGEAAIGSAYFSIALCGLLLAGLSALKLLRRVSLLFTTRIVGIVLLLIPFTMIPTILNLITRGADHPFTHLVFAFIMIALLLLGQRVLPGTAKSTMIVWALALGSLAYHGLVAGVWPQTVQPVQTAGEWQLAVSAFHFDPVVFISFLLCFLALTANDLGSIQSTGELLQVEDTEKRSSAGLLLTGLGNVLAGCLGVIGPVNYSFSSGIIIATGCASRLPLAVAAGGMLIVAFIPGIIVLFAYMPSVVTGSLLFYTMCLQAATGLMLLGKSLDTGAAFETGLIVGVALMFGILAAFLPGNLAASLPPFLKPLLTNGFVVGISSALILEHLVYAKSR
ncbi:uracil-xanthine permease family protein [Sporomusa aerivorans]|uniref:uracil-xanthine permease family protein n=1 Tax=Sporomusa aerivorans TaxID=204936 RepID=UPI00352AFAD6